MRPAQIPESLSSYFANDRALLPYSVLGLSIGVLSALVVLAFELFIILLADLWLPEAEKFEALEQWQRFVLPAASALLLAFVYSLLPYENRESGIVHVLSRMESHYGLLPIRNALLQFFAGAVALAGGQSGGREGPGVHLGAAVGSGLSQWLHLPHNSRRIVIACGTAGGIAAAFNTPLAGVIFAMEVIVAEYTVVGFTPVIVAAISATTLSHALGGGLTPLDIPAVSLGSLWDLPLILFLGLIAGTLAAAFTRILKVTLKHSTGVHVSWRFLGAGLLTGCTAMFVPEVLGLGYDSLHAALLGQLAPGLLAALLIAKLITSAFSVGLGLPVGVIGPSLLIGSCVGSLVGWAADSLMPGMAFQPGLYGVIGMGAVMAAMLNAPLAALLAVVELTGSASASFPAMLAVITANLTMNAAWRSRSAHQTVLQHLQRIIPEDPISQMLHQSNVKSAMDRSISVLGQYAGDDASPSQNPPVWCIVTRGTEYLALMRGTDVSQFTRSLEPGMTTDLLEQDLRRWTFSQLSP
ncbi:MAG: chloride channel protein, partial [Pseudomonadota bacterium]